MKLLKKIFGGWILFTIIVSFFYLLAVTNPTREDNIKYGEFYLLCAIGIIGILLLSGLVEFALKLINGKI